MALVPATNPDPAHSQIALSQAGDDSLKEVKEMQMQLAN